MVPLALVGCNTAPLWPDRSSAPDGNAPWFGPSDKVCLGEPDAVEYDGYLFCKQAGATLKVPIDDPIYTSCSADLDQKGDVLALFDGVRARAYPVDLMLGRELVNTDWDGEPVLVDY